MPGDRLYLIHTQMKTVPEAPLMSSVLPLGAPSWPSARGRLDDGRQRGRAGKSSDGGIGA